MNAGNGFFDDTEEFASERPFLLYAAYNWHEHMVLGGSRAHEALLRTRYASILDISKPPFWVWFLPLANYICSSTFQPTAVISTVWEAAARLKPQYGQLLREDCLGKLFAMDENVHLLLGHISKFPKS